MGPLLWKPWLCGWQGHWPNPLSARVERCKQSLMDKSSKRRLWTFKSLRTSETSKGGLRFALRDDHEPSHGFLPQDHMVSTRFSAGGADEVGHWGRPWSSPARQLPALAPLSDPPESQQGATQSHTSLSFCRALPANRFFSDARSQWRHSNQYTCLYIPYQCKRTKRLT